MAYRPQPIGPEPIRRVYYGLISILPTVVSATILGLYFGYEWTKPANYNHWHSGKNWFSVAAVILVAASFIFSLATSLQNNKWKSILEKSAHRLKSKKRQVTNA
jgi:hypothetical protein